MVNQPDLILHTRRIQYKYQKEFRWKNSAVNSREAILAAARRLAEVLPLDKINLTDVAKEAGVSWPTVRRYVGNKQQLRALLANEQPNTEHYPLDTRSRILASATQIFAQQGYAGATLDAIATDAGLTKGAVYWHFASKSDLFLALMEEWMQSRLPEIPEQVNKAFGSKNPEAGLAEFLQIQFRYGQTNPNWLKLYLEFVTQSREPEVQKMLSCTAYKTAQEMANGLVRQVQEQGQIAADIDPLVFATFFDALMDGLMLAWLVDPKRVDLEACTSQLARIIWRGIQPTGDSSAAP